MYTYNYPRPALTTDSLIFGYDTEIGSLKILLIKRKNEPFKNSWAIPGGFVDMDETVEQCAKRELKEETNLDIENLFQLNVASKVDRDPRGRTVSVIFFALIQINYNVKAQDDAIDIDWFEISNLPELAFDHSEIINFAINDLKLKIKLNQYFKEFFSDETILENLQKIQEKL